jgi:hypothetical protein
MRVASSSSPRNSAAGKALHGFIVVLVLLATNLAASWSAEWDLGGLRNRLQSWYVLWPQQWSFFVDLDINILEGYRPLPGRALMPSLTSPDLSSTWWGLDRTTYAVGSEIREIALKVPDMYWQSCDLEEVELCGTSLNEALAFPLAAPVRKPYLCGRLVVVVKKLDAPPPRHLSVHRAKRLALIDVTCPG